MLNTVKYDCVTITIEERMCLMKRLLLITLAVVTASIISGCVCTTTPVEQQKWYEYQTGYMRDGYKGNKPWYDYAITYPILFVYTWVIDPIESLFD